MNGVRSASVTSYQGAQASYAAGSAMDQPSVPEDVLADDARVLAQQRRQQPKKAPSEGRRNHRDSRFAAKSSAA